MNLKLTYALLLCYLSINTAPAQCLEEGQVFQPEPWVSNGDLFGSPMVGHQDFLLVSSTGNN